MRIPSLLLACLALSFPVASSACGSSGDNTPAPNPATGPAQGGGGSTGAGGDAQGGTAGAGGSGGEAGGSGGAAGAAALSIPGCSRDTAEDHTGDAAVAVTTPTGMIKYTPNCIRVKVGTKVTFDNSSTHPLRAMKTQGTQPNPIADVTPSAPTAAMLEVSFSNPGDYGYYCAVHGSDTPTPGMSGAVFVDP